MKLIITICCLLLIACSTKNTPTLEYNLNPLAYSKVDTMDLGQLEDMYKFKSSKDQSENEVNPIRLAGLKDAALTLGAQGALAYRSKELDDFLDKNAKHLSQIYNFQALVLDNNVLPPVIAESRDPLYLHDNDTIQIADKTYTIIQNVRFATAPPNWRDYLWLPFTKPEIPDPSILPKQDSEEERNAWKQYINEGWQQGLQQANAIFSENLAKLQRDYQGMVLYNKLVNERIINSPMVAKTELGITGGGDSVTINDRLYRITVHPSLNSNGKEWVPAVAQPFMQVAKTPQDTSLPMPQQFFQETKMEAEGYAK